MGRHRSANAIVTFSLYNVAALGLVTLCALVVEYAFGIRQPAKELEGEMEKRLRGLASFFHTLSEDDPSPSSKEFHLLHNQLIQYAYAGDFYLNELYDRLRYSNPGLSRVPLGIRHRVGLLTLAIEKSVLIGFDAFSRNVPDHRASYRAIAELCDELQSSASHLRIQSPAPSGPALASEIYLELQQYGTTLKQPDRPHPQSGFGYRVSRGSQLFLPGVFESPDGALHALNLTLAASICYVLYNAIAWPGILTCVVTVLVTGLTTTGTLKQKQAYRFAGALIGGFLGIAVVSLLYPNMDSIMALVCVIAPVSFLAGWILRNRWMGYVGYQIALAFFLTALPGSGATTSISPARDRLIGVALGILVMWFVFDQIWPVRTSEALRKSLLRIRQATRQIQQLTPEPDPPQRTRSLYQIRSAVSLELSNVQQLGFAARFEVGRTLKRELVLSRRLMRNIEASSAEFYAAARPVSDEWNRKKARP